MLLGLIIGLGSGLFVSGLLMSILVYSTTKEVSYHKAEPIPEQVKVLESMPNKEQPTEVKIETEAEDESANETNEQFEIQKQPVEITIPSYFTAAQIARLLEKEGIIEDSEDLIEYIISKHKTRSLQHGTKIFTSDSSNEEVLQILLSKN